MILIHTFVRFCMLLNPTMCRELEIVHADYSLATSTIDCLKGGAIYSGIGFRFDLDGLQWQVKGTRCDAEGSLPTTELQQRLRASVTP